MKNLTVRTLKSRYSNKLNKTYRLDVIEDENVARLFVATPKGKYRKEKQLFGYKFKNSQQMMDYINKDYNDRFTFIKEKEQRKIEQKKRDIEQRNSVKVGDVFCYSWGWEQTNVDFYQVVGKPSSSTIVVRPISYESVEDTSWASDNVVPLKDSFCGEEEKVRLTGKYFKRSCGTAIKTNWTDKHYRSWYA